MENESVRRVKSASWVCDRWETGEGFEARREREGKLT